MIPSASDIQARCAAPYARGVMQNNFRGHYVEAMVQLALDKDWRATSADWEGYDLEHRHAPWRLEVRQSAAFQSWSTSSPPNTRKARYSIRTAKAYWSGDTRVKIDSRLADAFIFGWCDTKTQNDPASWTFYVLLERVLGPGQSIALSRIRDMTEGVSLDRLPDRVANLNFAPGPWPAKPTP